NLNLYETEERFESQMKLLDYYSSKLCSLKLFFLQPEKDYGDGDGDDPINDIPQNYMINLARLINHFNEQFYAGYYSRLQWLTLEIGRNCPSNHEFVEYSPTIKYFDLGLLSRLVVFQFSMDAPIDIFQSLRNYVPENAPLRQIDLKI